MRKPALTRVTEAALNPVIGKSLVIYARKDEEPVSPNGRVVSSPSRTATRFAGLRQREITPPASRDASQSDGRSGETVLAPRDRGQADAAD